MPARRRFALALLAPLAMGQAPPPPLPPTPPTGIWAELAALPVPALAVRMMGAAGGGMVEAIVDQPTGLVVLAERPRNAGYYGLCAAQIVYLKLDDAGAARIERITSAFHAAGDVEQRAGWSDDYARQLDARCAPLRPIIDFAPPTRGSFHGVRAFGDDRASGNYASFAARALRRGIAAAPKLKIACIEDRFNPPPSCSDPAATLAAIDPAQLRSFDVDPCADAPAVFCVKAELTRRPIADDPRRLTVTLRTDRKLVEGTGDMFAVKAVSMEAATIVR